MNTPINSQFKIDESDIILTKLVLDHEMLSSKNYESKVSGQDGVELFSKEEFLLIIEKTKAESNEKSVLKKCL